MSDFSDINNPVPRRTHELALKLAALLENLLSDAATDVEVVAREFALKDAMRERLRRALDRVDCAQGVLEAMREFAGSEGARKDLRAERRGRGSGDGESHGGYENDDSIDAKRRAWNAMELLSEEWPKDYPEGAVEWLILEKIERSPTTATNSRRRWARKSPPR
jgi:hypothetical protein